MTDPNNPYGAPPYQQPPGGYPQQPRGAFGQPPPGGAFGQPPPGNVFGPPPGGGGFNNPYQPAGPGSYGGGGGFDQQDPNHGKVPGIVIAGFILSFLCSLVGLILCIIGLKEAKQRQAGEGLAIAGIVIAVIMMVLGAVMNLSRM